MSVADAQAVAWNRCVPEGSRILLVNDSAEIEETRTRSQAWAVGGHMAVVMVENRAGGYSLARCFPLPPEVEP